MIDDRLMLDCIHKRTTGNALIGQSNLLESVLVPAVPLDYTLLHYFIPSYQYKLNRVFIFPSRMLEHLKFPEFRTVTISYNLAHSRTQSYQCAPFDSLTLSTLCPLPESFSFSFSHRGVRAFLELWGCAILK